MNAGNMTNEPLILSADELAAATDGSWTELPGPIMRVKIATQGLTNGDLWITKNADQWGQNKDTETPKRLEIAAAVGISGAMVRNAYPGGSPCPLLRVRNTKEALWSIAQAARAKSTATWVLITGTEGKTGCKVQLAHVLQPFAPVHARLDSNNMDTAVCTTVANVRASDKISIVEVAVPRRSHGLRRARLVRPSICVITEIGYEHLRKHGSWDGLIAAKASVVEALEAGGVCIVKSDPRYYTKLRREIVGRTNAEVLTFGTGDDDNAQLLNKSFDAAAWGWNVKARIREDIVNYFVPVVEEHAVLGSLPVLLVAALLGMDPGVAAARLATAKPFQTQGRVETLPIAQGSYTLYDQSYRLYLLGLSGFFGAMRRLHAAESGKKILVLGNPYDEREYGPAVYELVPYAQLRQWIADAGIDALFTVGPKETFSQIVPEQVPWVAHAGHVRDIMVAVRNALAPDDLLFVKGDRDEQMFLLPEWLRNGIDR